MPESSSTSEPFYPDPALQDQGLLGPVTIQAAVD